MKRLLNRVGIMLVAIACTQPPGAEANLRPATRDDLLKEAHDKFNLDKERSWSEDDKAPISVDGALVGLEATALKMNKKWFAHSDHDWISVIKTNMRYDRMGLGAGMNYIFKLPRSDPAHELVVVPEDASIAPHYLTYNPYIDLTAGHHGPPLIIRRKVPSKTKDDAFVIGGCVECSIGHCGAMGAGDAYR